tara:strand:+ start:1520 stop:1738 length:219 start_codon:yes stop_codon:yes gene_type:complete
MKVTFQFTENGVLVVYDGANVFVFEDGPGDAKLSRSMAILNAVWHVFQDWCQSKESGGMILGFSGEGRDEDH